MSSRIALTRAFRGLQLLALSYAWSNAALAQGSAIQPPLQADAKPVCAVNSAKFASWFSSGKPALNGAVKAADSVGFTASSNCDFYDWSQQMFLWLTSPAPSSYGGNGRIFDSSVFYDVVPVDESTYRYVQHVFGSDGKTELRNFNTFSAQVGPHGLQTFAGKDGRSYEIVAAPLSADGFSLIRDTTGQFVEINRIATEASGTVSMFDRAGKKISFPAVRKLELPLVENKAPRARMLSDSATVGLVQRFKDKVSGTDVFIDFNGNQIVPTQGQAGGGAVLMAQNGSLIYYAMMVNDVFAFFQTGISNGAIPSPNKDPSLAFMPTTQDDLNTVVAYAKTKGMVFKDPNALAVEVKTSWVEIDCIDCSRYITTMAKVPEYRKTDQQWTPTGKSREVKLALIGMHVVGSVAGHPEMIWATYEHFDNAPWLAFDYKDASGNVRKVDAAKKGRWNLSVENAPITNYNVQFMGVSGRDIVAEKGKKIAPSNTVRVNPWGTLFGASGPSAADLNTEVISSNNSVIGQILKGDVRANYMLTGAIWVNGSTILPSTQAGTLALANATMETYKQGDPTGAGLQNCFVCHTTDNNAKTVGVSHLFLGLRPLFPK